MTLTVGQRTDLKGLFVVFDGLIKTLYVVIAQTNVVVNRAGIWVIWTVGPVKIISSFRIFAEHFCCRRGKFRKAPCFPCVGQKVILLETIQTHEIKPTVGLCEGRVAALRQNRLA